MPRDAGDRRYCAELVDDVAWNEIDVIMSQLQIGILDAFTSKLVKLSIINPYDTLHKYTVHSYVSHINMYKCFTCVTCYTFYMQTK